MAHAHASSSADLFFSFHPGVFPVSMVYLFYSCFCAFLEAGLGFEVGIGM